MTALERLREEIILTSPLKKRFSAFWIGNPQEMEKSLGLKKYPKIPGVFVQDMDVGGISYPLNFFFSGDDHDLEAAAFFQACRENGAWEIIHPTEGKKNLFLAKVKRNIEPVKNANISDFESNWIESIAKEQILSRANIPDSIDQQVTIINNTAADEFERKVVQETETQKQAIRDTSRSLLSRIKSSLAKLYQLSNEINARVNAVQSAINSTLDEFILKPLQLAAQFQQLIQLPALALNNISSRLEAYQELAASIISDLSPSTTLPRDKNIAACLELTLSATLGAGAQSLVTGPLNSRQSALEHAEFLLILFGLVTDGLDGIEALFKDLQADQQFLSQTESYALLSAMIAEAVAATIKSSFDLSIEKRFILEKDRAPVEITITEYGELGENDSNLDLFNSSNFLQGDDLILLPAGQEIVVYV